ncbi:MAG: hypothetical protein AAGC74_11285 [Verrucomicrobiota bacterium]
MNPADAHALTMLLILAFSLGSILTMFILMFRNAEKKQDLPEFPEIDQDGNLKDEEEKAPTAESDDPSLQNWERDADWWRKN